MEVIQQNKEYSIILKSYSISEGGKNNKITYNEIALLIFLTNKLRAEAQNMDLMYKKYLKFYET